jgi:cytochrome oxidase assembly protein ShyY1
MKNLLELIKALTPLVQVAMPVLLLLATWWISKQNKKTTAAQTTELKQATVAQTTELKAHSDDNREQIKNTVVSATGTFKALGSGP